MTLLPLWDRVIGALTKLGLVWTRARLINASLNKANPDNVTLKTVQSPDFACMEGIFYVIPTRMVYGNYLYITHLTLSPLIFLLPSHYTTRFFMPLNAL